MTFLIMTAIACLNFFFAPTLLSVLCPMIIWLTLVLFLTSVCLAIQDGLVRLRRLHNIPCSRCVYFTGDYRLKCTVHPCQALTEAAIGCFDYEQRTVKPAHSSCPNFFSEVSLLKLRTNSETLVADKTPL